MLKLLSVFCVNVFNDSFLITKVISTIVDRLTLPRTVNSNI